MYEDNYCTVYIHDVYGNGDLLVVHTDVIPTKNREVLEHYFDVIEAVFEGLREKGKTEVEAWVCTEKEERFAQFYGFTEFLGELLVSNMHCTPAVYRLRKKL